MTLYPDNSKNRKNPNKIKFTTWDIETDYPDNPLNVTHIGFFDGKEYKMKKTDQMYNKTNNGIFEWFISETLKPKYYGFCHYAHFGGKFDFLYLLETLKNYGYDFDIIDVNGRILSIKINFGEYIDDKNEIAYKTFIEYRDSFAIMPKSLKSLTSSFNVEHQKQIHEFTHEAKEEICEAHKLKNCQICFDKYLEYDCKGLYECIEYFENIINSYGGELKLTIASCGMDLLKHKYFKKPIYSLDEQTEADIRSYYFGGRTEIFIREIEEGYYYDINSLYPKVMADNDMPISRPTIHKSPYGINIDSDMGFVYCNIDFKNTKEIIPLIPYKMKINNSTKLIYPEGAFKSWIDLDMYRKALKLGYEIKILKGITFYGENIFKDYVNDFYALRSKSESLKVIGKLLLNAPYGKFAQKREKRSMIKYDGINEEYLKTLMPIDLKKGLFHKDSISQAKHIIPSISSHITTLAQLELYKLFERVGFDNVYYCDTDSMITNKKLQTSKLLGDIKQEYKLDKGYFLLPKTYYIEGINDKNEFEKKIVMKGFLKDQINVTKVDFKEAILTNNYEKFRYSKDKLFSFKESLKRNNSFLTYGSKISSIQSNYDKRIVLDDKIHTKAYKLTNGEIIKEINHSYKWTTKGK